MRAIDTVR